MNALFAQYPMNFFGVAVAVSVLAGLLLALGAARTVGFHTQEVSRALFTGALVGLACARIAAVLFNLDLFHADWWGVLRVYEGGYMLNFGLMGGITAACLCIKGKRVPAFMDAISMPLFAALALGQLACLWSGEGLGFRVPERYAYFPLAVFVGGGAYFPLFLARALWYCVICGALRFIAPGMRHGGDIMLWGIMLYAAAGVVFESMAQSSVFVEFVRVDQALCMLVVLALIGVFFHRRRTRGDYVNVILLAVVALMTGAAFFAEFYMGESTQAAYWALMALAMAAIVACGAVFYTRARR